jgi:hypothetical protein
LEIKKFKGIRNTDSPERFATGELETAVNVDINNSGSILSREGLTTVSATACHSLFSEGGATFLAQDINLKSVASDLTLTQLATLSNEDPISYARSGPTTYYSNGTDTGKIVGSTRYNWGVEIPSQQPTATAVSGDLPPGRYMFAITYRRSDGHESGTGLAGLIELPTGGGIFFSDIQSSTDPFVFDIIVYLSSPNGEVLYKAFVIPNGITSAFYTSDSLDLTIPLTTQFAGPPPPGTIVREFNGGMYVVVDDMIYFSDAYQPELFRLDTNFLRLPHQVGMLECVNSGLYVATVDADDGAATWYFAGGRPDQMVPVRLFDYGVIAGTAVQTLASFLETNLEGESRGEQAGLAVIWATRHGICVGRDGGAAVNLTEVKYSMPSAESGAAYVKQADGFVQYVATLRGAGTANNIYGE